MPHLFRYRPKELDRGTPVASLEDLKTCFDRLVSASEELPTIAVVDDLHACTLLVAVDRSESVITIVEERDASGVSEEWISIGDPARTGCRDFFLIGEDHSPLEAMHLISTATAWQVVADFYRTGNRSPLVEWDHNSF